MTTFDLNFDPYFDRIGLLAATEQFKEPESFFLDKFFTEMDESVDTTVRIDFYDELRRLAPFVHRKVKGELIETKGQKAFFYEPPYIRSKMTITPQDMRKVIPGSHPYADQSLAQNMAELIARKMNEANRMIERREELMAIQGIVNGEIPIVDSDGNALDESITFSRDTALADGTANWATVSTSDPVEDWREDARRIADLSGLQADTIVLGTSLVPKFKNSTNVKDQLDNRRIEDGSLAQRAISLGARYLGTVEDFMVFSYNWKYANPATNALVDAFPTNKYLIGSSQARCVRLYGGIEDVDMITPAQRYPKSWKDDELGIRFMQIESAPLPAVTQPNAFRVRTVTV